MELQHTVSTSTLQLLDANIGRIHASVKCSDCIISLIQTMDGRWKPVKDFVNPTVTPKWLRACAWAAMEESDAKLDAWIEEEEVWQELGFSNL